MSLISNKVEPSGERCTTIDLYLAAFLRAKGASIVSKKSNDRGQVEFELDVTGAPSLVDQYMNNEALVDPLLYKYKITELKDVIFNNFNRRNTPVT